MGNVIEHDGSGNEGAQSVSVGDQGSAVSIKTYQDIYHQVTGRTEQIKQRYSDNILIEFAEIEQLHHKVIQLCDVHRVVAHNEVISVFHEKERKEQFTSFDRFRAYNTNASRPTINVVLKYNFSIIPAGLQRPQEYVINIRLTSRVAITKQLQEDAQTLMGGQMMINFFFINDTAEVTVDYADYVIARGFLEAFDEWIKGCKSTPKNKWLIALRRKSHFAPDIMRIGIAFLIGVFALRGVPDFFGASLAADKGARFLITYITAAYILIFLASVAGRMIEIAIDSYPVLSYLKLNRGDINLIDEFQERKKKVILKFIGGVVLAVVLGIVSIKLEKLM